MQHFEFLRPASLDVALQSIRAHPDARWLAGGQSLLAAMRLGLSAPSHLIDLQDIPGLQDIRLDGDTLQLGAMVTHARVAASDVVRRFCPMLAELAAGIADAQIRAVGTVGGALANNDPAACWPAGMLALDACFVTDRRTIPADAFFTGLYATALQAGEMLLAVRIPRPDAAHYIKQEQMASRFALVGVAVARFATGAQSTVRIAVIGMGQGVQRWVDAEQRLSAQWAVAQLDGLAWNPSAALGDLHASADYRAHLARVLCRRCIAAIALPGNATVQDLSPPARPQAPAPVHRSPFRTLIQRLEHFLQALFRR